MKKTNTTKKNSAAKKLLPAFAMLMVSASMLATSTYAWFSMNKDVTVTGMSVTAKSDTTFLVVKAVGATANTLDGVKTYNHTSDDANTPTAQLYPAAHDDIAATVNATAIDAADQTNTSEKDIWYYRYNKDPNYSTSDMTAITYIPTADFDDYVLVNAFDLTVNGADANSISNLKVASCTITQANKTGTETAGDAAVKVLVAGPNGNAEFDGTGNATGSNNVICSSITNAALSQVKVYVYWDGNDADVYTNGAADLTNTSVEIEFTGTIVST